MNHETPEPANDAEKDAALAHQRWMDDLHAHLRAIRESNQALLRQAAQNPAGFIDELQKLVEPKK